MKARSYLFFLANRWWRITIMDIIRSGIGWHEAAKMVREQVTHRIRLVNEKQKFRSCLLILICVWINAEHVLALQWYTTAIPLVHTYPGTLIRCIGSLRQYLMAT